LRPLPPIIPGIDRITINPVIINPIKVKIDIAVGSSIIKPVQVNPTVMTAVMNSLSTGNPMFSTLSMKKARQALENLPGVAFLNQLVQSGT
jgi:hypothetical protein